MKRKEKRKKRKETWLSLAGRPHQTASSASPVRACRSAAPSRCIGNFGTRLDAPSTYASFRSVADCALDSCISISMPPEAWLNERVASGLCAAAADMSACPEKTGPGWLPDQILISNYTRKPVPADALRGPYVQDKLLPGWLLTDNEGDSQRWFAPDGSPGKQATQPNPGRTRQRERGRPADRQTTLTIGLTRCDPAGAFLALVSLLLACSGPATWTEGTRGECVGPADKALSSRCPFERGLAAERD